LRVHLGVEDESDVVSAFMSSLKTRRPLKTHNDIIMVNYMAERIRQLPEKKRKQMDTSKMTTIDVDIKNFCVEVTMDMLRKLQVVADPTTYPNVARYMLVLANVTPIKCICIGISPYENGILPSFAGAMSYSPKKCMGSTPSVQVLSQAMSAVSAMIKDQYVRNSRFMSEDNIPTREEYISKFAMMLRCSYACVMAGVAFVNASPVITSNVAKRVRCASIFSEWIGNMVAIHHKHGYKLTVVSMGALAESSMNDVFKSYADTKTSISFTKTANPAMMQHMSVRKDEAPNPIPDETTHVEEMLDEIVGTSTRTIIVSSFPWYEYSDSLLLRIVKPNSIMQMTRLLVDEAPDELLNSFLNKVIELMTNNMSSMNAAMDFVMGLPAIEDHGSGGGGDDSRSLVGESQQPQQYQQMGVNPFLAPAATETMGGSSGGGGGGQNQYQNRGANPNSESAQGPPMASRRSMIGQMVDPGGKAVSQHVIVLDSMLRTLSECVTGYKELSDNMVEVINRQAQMYGLMENNRIRTPDDIASLDEYLDNFAEFTSSMMRKMESTYGVVAALPAAVEGDRGVYEHESQPMGPLMRRADGSTMKEYVYGHMKDTARRNEDIDAASRPIGDQQQVVPQPQHQTMRPSAPASVAGSTSGRSAASVGLGFNPFMQNAQALSDVNVRVDISTTGDETVNREAQAFVYEAVDEALEEIEGDTDLVEGNLGDKKINCAKGDISVVDCIAMIVAEYMETNEGTKPDISVIKDIVEVLNDDENSEAFIQMIPQWIKNTTSAMEMFAFFEDDSDSDSDATA